MVSSIVYVQNNSSMVQKGLSFKNTVTALRFRVTGLIEKLVYKTSTISATIVLYSNRPVAHVK